MTYMINELLGPFLVFTITGLVFWAMLLYGILKETVRAVRQSHRIATVHTRLQAQRRKPTFKMWFRCFRREFFSTYSRTRIGHFELDHDPNIKAKPCR